MKHELDKLEAQCERLEANIESVVLTLGDQSALLTDIDKTLSLNTLHLEEHMKRTAILERELKPLIKHVEQVRGAGKLILLLSLIATILAVLR